MNRRLMRTVPGVVLSVCAAVWAAGCSADGTVRVRSEDGTLIDKPTLPVSAYAASDPNTADIYLTDLDAAALDRGTDLSKLAGRITHIHMFLAPLAGNTPIESSACSVTIRHIILASGAIGVYSGGGFLMPRGRPGDSSFGGTIQRATLRLTARAGAFADRLGPATMDARVLAPHDESLAKRIGAREEDVLGTVRGENGTATVRERTSPSDASTNGNR